MSNIKIIHISNAGSKKLVSFEELSNVAKNVARLSTLQVEVDAFGRILSEYKKLSLHQRINRNTLSGLIHIKKNINILLNNPSKYDSTIIGNFCSFLQDGTYVVYALNQYKHEN